MVKAEMQRTDLPKPVKALPMSMRHVGSFSHGIASMKHATALLGCQDIVLRPKRGQRLSAVVGWGLKDNTITAMNYAYREGLPYFRLEDGFLRSVGLGVSGDTALSMVVDDQGMYYDARRSSRLETLLNCAPELEDPALLHRAEAAMERIREAELSKYNSAPIPSKALPATSASERVLVIDQTAGDMSVVCGLGRPGVFQEMLESALRENPEAQIVVKTHPDVLSGKKRGYLGRLPDDMPGRDRILLWAENSNPIALLKQVDRVYTVTSQMGFEALIVGKRVTCFGAPFYAGWGLTDDRLSLPRRKRKRRLAQVFAAAYILYSRYVDPDTGKPCQLETVIDHLALQREQFVKNQGRIFCFGFRIWKHNYVRAYLRCPGNEVLFPRSAEQALALGFDANSKLLVWGQRAAAETERLQRDSGVRAWRMEDAFLRSVGLGSDMSTPASLVVDREGIYYDPTNPSELETILRTEEFSPALLARAKAFRRLLLESGLSKYNVGHLEPLKLRTEGRKVVLVPGQVEDDASIKLGCRSIRTNLDLLREARRACPDSFIIFKPHPDVLSGNRKGGVPTVDAREFCDRIEEDASLTECLAVADEIHVMTSLVGFEALLRGLTVHCYGQPFYAGWGLTCDLHPVDRRGRERTIDELIAATYFAYPRYLHRGSLRFTSPEIVARQLIEERDSAAEPLKVSWAQRQLRKLRHIARELQAEVKSL